MCECAETHWEALFESKRLPTEFSFWKSCANGLVRVLREKGTDGTYYEEAERFANFFNSFVDEPCLDEFGRVALDMVKAKDAYAKNDEAPLDVKSTYDLLEKTINVQRPKVKAFCESANALDNARMLLDEAKTDLDRLDRYLDRIGDRLKELEEEIYK